VRFYGQLYIEQFVYTKLDHQFASSVLCSRVTEKVYKYALSMQWVNAKTLDWQIDVIWEILTNTKL